MQYHVVCISGADGAGGEEVGRIVAERLGFRLINEAIISRAAREAGVERHVVADVERRKSFVARLLEDLGPNNVAAAAAVGGFPPSTYEPIPASDDLRGLIRTVIEETAAQGDAVIVAHAASAALSAREDTLRVLVTASEDVRRQRLSQAQGLEEKQAAKIVDEADAARADYLKRFYGLRAELPIHYDLVVNTDRLAVEQAAELIIRAATSTSALDGASA